MDHQPVLLNKIVLHQRVRTSSCSVVVVKYLGGVPIIERDGDLEPTELSSATRA
jgi:hypothetical protein